MAMKWFYPLPDTMPGGGGFVVLWQAWRTPASLGFIPVCTGGVWLPRN